MVLAFAEAFQGAEEGVQARLIEWTRTPGRLLLLLPPFTAAACERPVPWRAERMESAPHGGEGLAKLLAPEVAYRLTGKLQTPAVPAQRGVISALPLARIAFIQQRGFSR